MALARAAEQGMALARAAEQGMALARAAEQGMALARAAEQGMALARAIAPVGVADLVKLAVVVVTLTIQKVRMGQKELPK
jgi:apolipoprotein N-acyltransferase